MISVSESVDKSCGGKYVASTSALQLAPLSTRARTSVGVLMGTGVA
jgi:hypothetical protein